MNVWQILIVSICTLIVVGCQPLSDLERAELMLARDEFADALALCDQQIAHHETPQWLTQKGRTLIQMRSEAEAEKVLLRSLQLDEKYDETYYELERLYKQTNRLELAEQMAAKAEEHDNKDFIHAPNPLPIKPSQPTAVDKNASHVKQEPAPSLVTSPPIYVTPEVPYVTTPSPIEVSPPVPSESTPTSRGATKEKESFYRDYAVPTSREPRVRPQEDEHPVVPPAPSGLPPSFYTGPNMGPRIGSVASDKHSSPQVTSPAGLVPPPDYSPSDSIPLSGTATGYGAYPGVSSSPTPNLWQFKNLGTPAHSSEGSGYSVGIGPRINPDALRRGKPETGRTRERWRTEIGAPPTAPGWEVNR